MKRIRLSSQARKAFQGSSPGFTLIEVLIALALIAIIGITFAGGLSTASKTALTADIRTNAESLARSQMEYVKNQQYDNTDPQSYEHDYVESSNQLGYFISVSAEPLHNPDDGIQQITVIVKYEGREVITLVGYKLDR